MLHLTIPVFIKPEHFAASRNNALHKLAMTFDLSEYSDMRISKISLNSLNYIDTYAI